MTCFCEAQPMGFRVMPLVRTCCFFMNREHLCLKHLPQFSIDLLKMCHTWTLWSVDVVQNIICVSPNQRFQSYAPFWNSYISIINREKLCLKPLPPFSSHPNETCYMRSLWKVDVHHILFEAWHMASKVTPLFSKFKHIHNR